MPGSVDVDSWRSGPSRSSRPRAFGTNGRQLEHFATGPDQRSASRKRCPCITSACPRPARELRFTPAAPSSAEPPQSAGRRAAAQSRWLTHPPDAGMECS